MFQAKAFLEVAATLDDYKFGISGADDVASEYSVDGQKVVLFKQFDEGKNEFEGDYEVEALTKFVEANAMPLVVEFNHESAQKIFSGAIKSHLLLFVRYHSRSILLRFPIMDFGLRIWVPSGQKNRVKTQSTVFA